MQPKRYPVLLTESELNLVEAFLSHATDLGTLIQTSTLPEVNRLQRLRDRFRDAISAGPAQKQEEES